MNNIVLAVLQGVVVMAVAPFFSGLGRVIRAKMHNRRGPSIMQDYRDLAKLFARPESQSEDASFALRIMPPLFFAVAFMLAMGLPLFTAQSPIPVFGDAITIMYSLALARFFFALCGVDSSNAYAGIGGVRELLMSVLIEPSMLLALFAAALVCGSTDIATMGQHIMTGAIDAPVAVILAGIAFAIACYMTPTAKKAGMKALIITHIGALGLYLGAAIVFAHTGTFAITAIAGLDAKLKAIVLLLVLFAAWAKSAQVPMYMWLPSAMEAPTPVSAYLHGASMVKVGVCVFARALVSAGEIPEIVGWVAIIDAMVTMLFGFLMYLPQKDMKRLLAFSTIAQLSYVFFGLGLSVFGSQLAFDGAVCHIFNHAFAKTLFFLIAGSFSFTLGTRMLPKLRGIVKKYPISGVGFGVATLAIAGVPPMNTFFSKFQIIAGGFSVGAGNVAILVLVCIMVAETVATFAWFLKWMGYCLPGEPSDEVAAGAPLPHAMAFVFIVLIIMVIVSGPLSASWIG